MIERIVPVNAFWIRQTLDTDFGIYHRHGSVLDRDYSRKSYVPDQEIWADHLHIGELPYLLQMEKKFAGLTGAAYLKKRQKILRDLQSERRSQQLEVCEFITHERHEGAGLVVCEVDGPKVRRYIDPEFVQGGHHLVYPEYIRREKEIWIDAAMDPRDEPHTARHELEEYKLMASGKSYDVAHEFATAAEKESRIRVGGCYPGFANPHGYTPDQLLKYYLDLKK